MPTKQSSSVFQYPLAVVPFNTVALGHVFYRTSGVPNTKSILPNPRVVETFVKEIYPLYKDDDRVDILLNNTDFGVGV